MLFVLNIKYFYCPRIDFIVGDVSFKSRQLCNMEEESCYKNSGTRTIVGLRETLIMYIIGAEKLNKTTSTK